LRVVQHRQRTVIIAANNRRSRLVTKRTQSLDVVAPEFIGSGCFCFSSALPTGLGETLDFQ
jgi:hypothetical protein